MKTNKWLLLLPLLFSLFALGCYIFFQPGIQVGGVFMQQVSVADNIAVYQYKNNTLKIERRGNTQSFLADNGQETGEFSVVYYKNSEEWAILCGSSKVAHGNYSGKTNAIYATLVDTEYEKQLAIKGSRCFPRGNAMLIHPDDLVRIAAGFSNAHRGRVGFLILGAIVLGIFYLTTNTSKIWRAASNSLASTGQSGQPLPGGANAYNVAGAWWMPSGRVAPVSDTIETAERGKGSYYPLYCAVMLGIVAWCCLLALRFI